MPEEAPEPDILCKVTPWFYRRMGLMVLMFAAFACWFLYDGKVKWPKQNAVAAEYERFMEMADDYDTFVEEDRLPEWLPHAEAKGYPVLEDGTPPKWSKYGAGVDLSGPAQAAWEARGGVTWPEKKPKVHTEDDIRGQFRWAAGCGVIGLLIAGYTLFTRTRTISADASAYITPGGERVPFDAIFRVDKRKWDNKGLAYFHYRKGADDGAADAGGEEGDDGPTGAGESAKATLDDLKFGGAHLILERVLKNFEGELVETLPDEEDEPAEAEADEPTPAKSPAAEGGSPADETP